MQGCGFSILTCYLRNNSDAMEPFRAVVGMSASCACGTLLPGRALYVDEKKRSFVMVCKAAAEAHFGARTEADFPARAAKLSAAHSFGYLVSRRVCRAAARLQAPRLSAALGPPSQLFSQRTAV